MIQPPALWIREAEVVRLMDLADAIDALETGLRQEAAGAARTMSKTHVGWGDGSTLHAIGAAYEGLDIIGTKSWAHTPGGATPLLILWNAGSGALLAIVEAFALGQMRTGAMSGVATRWMAGPDADSFALFGTGKQALAQLAAIAAVRRLKSVRIWGRDPGRRARLADATVTLGHDFRVHETDLIAEAAADSAILTLATRARAPFLTSALVAKGAHVNAIGAITPEREEFSQDMFARADLIAADDPAAARGLSREFGRCFGPDETGWARVRPVSALVAEGRSRTSGDLSIFKAMGMGLSDLALGIELYRRAVAANLGMRIDHPWRVAPRLGISHAGDKQ